MSKKIIIGSLVIVLIFSIGILVGASENSMVQTLKNSLRIDVKVVTDPMVNDMDTVVGEIIEDKLKTIKWVRRWTKLMRISL